ncbi:MAG TPA: type II secretion system protein [Candidatus Paceibacterota bacterium]|nr:type II secretion system protein [Candidatus Paceibacterota bacterium]HRZ34526.1 type II secretion system protein [Candidatus Paceibacterota bacterium]
MPTEKKLQKGFTLLEFLIYFAITLIMLGVITQVSLNILDGKEKIRAYEEVSRSGRSSLNAMIEAISEADEVLGTSGEEPE